MTAVSGSGPAYVFLFVEEFIKAARSLGFDSKTSRDLVMQTIYGSLGMLAVQHADPAELRRKVTSKGGTTFAALTVFEKGKYGKIFRDALFAARKRAKELAK